MHLFIKNYRGHVTINRSEKWDGSLAHPLPYLILHFPPPFPSLPIPSPLLSKGPLSQLRGLAERYKLLQRDPGQSPDRTQIWCSS